MKGSFPSLVNSRTQQLWTCRSSFSVKDRRKDLCENATKDRFVLWVSLNGSLVERPQKKAVKLKPGLSLRPQDVRDASVVGYLPSRTAKTE